jgi:MarR family 2-MHQ and catechol resistance regulon transcriptional repressor
VTVGTKYKGTGAEVRALDAYIRLERAAESVGARLAGLPAEAGLTDGQFGVLEALFHLGPLHQRELGAKLLRSGGNITVVVDNLEKRGLVRRERRVDDRRFVTVHLTAAGRGLIRRIFPRHVAAIVRELSVLTPDEQEELGRLCRKVGLQGNGSVRKTGVSKSARRPEGER